MIFRNQNHVEGKQIFTSGHKNINLIVPEYLIDTYSMMKENEYPPYLSSEKITVSSIFHEPSTFQRDTGNNSVMVQNPCIIPSKSREDLGFIPLWKSDTHISKLLSKWCICDSMISCSQNFKFDWQNGLCSTPTPPGMLSSQEDFGFCSEKYQRALQTKNKRDHETFVSELSIENQNGEDFNQIRDPEYHNRKDVVIKNIFRTFRKFFALKFRHFYDFTKKKMSRIHPSESEIIDCVKEYVSRTFGSEDNITTIALIVALLDPKGKYTHQRGIFALMKEHVCRFLFKFNKKHLYELFQIPQFITLMRYFLNQVDVDTLIPRYRRDLDTFGTYTRQIETIRKICMDQRLASSKHIYKFF